MVFAAIDIHKHAFQAAVFDSASGEVVEQRFSADRQSLGRWAERWHGRVEAVAIEATTGWRWVWRELSQRGFDVRLAEPVQARGLLGRRRSAKTDRLDARWLARLLAREMLPQSWIPPAEIQQLRDRTRLRKALAEDRRRWAQRLHAYLLHEGWPCSRSRLLSAEGLRWASALRLPEHARLQVDSLLAVMGALETQVAAVDTELRRFARGDERCRALQAIYGVGPILACHLLAEIGEASRFAAPSRSRAWPASIRSSRNRARRVVAATWPRPARRICAGHWLKRPCTRIAQPHLISSSTAPHVIGATRRSPA
jgi:transposase